MAEEYQAYPEFVKWLQEQRSVLMSKNPYCHHAPDEECSIEEPHKIRDCKKFLPPSDKTPAFPDDNDGC